MEKQIDYLRKLTDDFGIVQFANDNNPDIKTGYTIDDVSRALIVSSKLGIEDLSEIYFNFVKNAQTYDGGFVNVYSGEKKPLEEIGSEDSFGRTLWALGEYFSETGKGEEISFKAIKSLKNKGIHYPISESFALLGLTRMYDAGFERKNTGSLIKTLADSLVRQVNTNSGVNWLWVSDEMSYENARIPQALFRAHSSLANSGFHKYANSLTNFLNESVFEEDSDGKNFLNVVGNNTSGLEGTWYKKGSIKPKFDEQPVDAGGMIELHSEAYKINGDLSHLNKAEISLDWFYGRNRLGMRMVSTEGGVYDGLNENRVNPNQGAESLLSYMMAKIKFDETFGKGLYTKEKGDNHKNKNGLQK